MARRFDASSRRPVSDRTHVQDGPRPERSDHSNLGPQERTPHPTVRDRTGRRPQPSPLRHAGAR